MAVFKNSIKRPFPHSILQKFAILHAHKIWNNAYGLLKKNRLVTMIDVNLETNLQTSAMIFYEIRAVQSLTFSKYAKNAWFWSIIGDFKIAVTFELKVIETYFFFWFVCFFKHIMITFKIIVKFYMQFWPAST